VHETIYGFPDSEENSFFQITICGISYCDGTYHIERRNSQVYTLEYILSGEGEILLPGGSRIRPVQGDVYLLHRGENHCYFSDAQQPWIKIWCNVSGRLVDQLIQLYHLEHTHLITQCCIEPQLRQFLKIASDSGLSRSEIWDQEELIFHRILQILARRVHPCPIQIPAPARILQEYLDRSLDRPVSARQLADLVSLSPSQVSRIFKAAFHVSPYEYLLERRILMARKLLQNTSLSVKQISFSLGFSDEHYFSTFFRRRTGMAPLVFRQRKQP